MDLGSGLPVIFCKAVTTSMPAFGRIRHAKMDRVFSSLKQSLKSYLGVETDGKVEVY